VTEPSIAAEAPRADEKSISIHPDIQNWLLDGLHHTWESFERFFRTGARMMVQPRQFAADWAHGELRAFNPLGFFATSVGVTSTLGLLVGRLVRPSASHTSVEFLVHEFDPYLQYFLLGLLCHAFLKLFGVKRPWFLTLGVSLFAGGGPAAAADLLTEALTVVISLGAGASESLTASVVSTVAVGGILVANLAFFVTFALGLAGIHRLKHWRIIVALLGAQVTLALLRVLFFKALLWGSAE
jgi:hypothetical protein